MRKKIAAANWKMNLRIEQGEALLDGILSKNINLQPHQHVVFAVPFPYLAMARDKVAGKNNYSIAAQNCYDKASGAFTGEVSAEMLESLHIPFVVLGHSERREYFSESNDMLARKTDIVLSKDMTPIFCCGEALSIREADGQNAYVENQLKESLFHLNAEQISKIVIAYEPIWAIGTGKTASSAQAQEMHLHIRNVLAAKYGTETADQISVLYGGSVNGANAAELFSQPDVDGGLVGGASLKVDDFSQIISALK
ncbi:MAG TPA: triose-phosphate isomerase [Chitinophagaceae bacterium]|nr:triose-phosphate isomerase [Chitinophagaceae bacterium]